MGEVEGEDEGEGLYTCIVPTDITATFACFELNRDSLFVPHQSKQNKNDVLNQSKKQVMLPSPKNQEDPKIKEYGTNQNTSHTINPTEFAHFIRNDTRDGRRHTTYPKSQIFGSARPAPSACMSKTFGAFMSGCTVKTRRDKSTTRHDTTRQDKTR